MIVKHKQEDFSKMRKAGKLAADLLDFAEQIIEPGITTNYINELCHKMIIENNAIPAPLNYNGFPKSICTSVNHVVCHGIPSDKILKVGDIINVDITVIVDGWHGDSSRTFFVGGKSHCNNMTIKLVSTAYECMMLGIEKIRPGLELNEIGRVIQNHAERLKFSVVRDYCGHGIGRKFHAEPNVLHYYHPNYSITLEPGMFFTVEPMINMGKHETKLLSDGWTVVTRDKSLSAQFEHTVGVTETGFEIFTSN
nr:type I methionyl aminopeptidase [Candidatus Cyrtobacter comes]